MSTILVRNISLVRNTSPLPSPDSNLPSLEDVGVGTCLLCSTTPLFIFPPPFYQLPHLPVRSSQTDNLPDERADVTSPIDEVLAVTGTNEERVQRPLSINLVTLFLSREGLGPCLFLGVVQPPQRMEDVKPKG